jgi:hypothetical protein
LFAYPGDGGNAHQPYIRQHRTREVRRRCIRRNSIDRE